MRVWTTNKSAAQMEMLRHSEVPVELSSFEGAAPSVEGCCPSSEHADGVDDLVAVAADPRDREEVALVVVAAAAT